MTSEGGAPEGDTIRLELPAAHKYLGVLSACLAELLAHVEGMAESADVTFHVQLAVQEICTNIVEHAYAGQPDGRIASTLILAPEPRQLIVDLLDAGRSFDPAAVPDLDLSEAHEGGYGLMLARSVMDEVVYSREADQNHWRLVKKL